VERCWHLEQCGRVRRKNGNDPAALVTGRLPLARTNMVSRTSGTCARNASSRCVRPLAAWRSDLMLIENFR
jgi:hypothetical protein